MKQTYLMPNTQTAVFVESKMMQMISPSQDNPAYAGNTGTNAGIQTTAPKKP